VSLSSPTGVSSETGRRPYERTSATRSGEIAVFGSADRTSEISATDG
jgi:hypothetical protein